jgi:phosphoribosylformimino-5-aminoimidazole carboxamide ribotide isomerase
VPFVPIPAIDIREGRCVRLLQGDFRHETVYGDDPVEVARRWEAEGAARLHVVDLDGARDGVRRNAHVVGMLLRSVSIPVQVGGGIRGLQTAEQVLAEGADRVVVGTAALERLDDLRQWVMALKPERLIVGVDTRDGRVATRGWLETTTTEAVAFCEALARAGVRRILHTDIGRDGMLEGPNIPAVRAITRGGRLRVLASGGVAVAEHLRELANSGAEGAIIGRALYEGRLRLADALAMAQAVGDPTC